MDINSLDYRANVIKETYENKPIYIYESHRYILNVLFDSFKKNVLAQPITLIFFDKHDDARVLSQEKKDKIIEISENISEYTYQKFYEFVEFEEDSDNGGRLYTAIELGFIKDIVLFSSENGNLANLKSGKNEYEDHKGDNHVIYVLNNLWSEIGYQGDLSDRARSSQLQGLRDVLGRSNKEGYREMNPPNKIIVDFDLDNFSSEVFGEIRAIPYDLLESKMEEYSTYINRSAKDFLKQLIQRSEIVTIAREQYHCGGITESTKILHMLDDIFFDGAICK